ncbi:unnamed protein product, partial [Mesorhabditis belari]|uniref:Uncharacterized protein n=1 Tax=Mesorhabditis belari TaxID=2138241 RepID=A0AAF3EPF2_9BILA
MAKRQNEHRKSLIALLSIQPILREDEPEHEEGGSRCLPTLPSPSSFPHRKVSMPELNPIIPKLNLKRTSLQPGSQAFQSYRGKRPF